MKTRFLLILSLFLAYLLVSQAWAQTSRSSLEKKRKNLNKQIKNTSSLLSSTTENKRSTIYELKTLQTEIQSREELVGLISEELKKIDLEIAAQSEKAETFNADLQKLKEGYHLLLRQLYRYKSQQNPALYILSADNFSQIFQRWTYLRHLEGRRRSRVEKIQSAQSEYSSQSQKLELEKLEKAKLLDDELEQTKALAQAIREKDRMIIDLKSKEKQLKRDLKSKEKSKSYLNKKIENIIRNQIASTKNASRSYQGSNKNVNPSAGLPKMNDKALAAGFAGRKGRLPMPVKTGVIVGHYGRQSHPLFRQVHTNNNGIDIKSRKYAQVNSVYEGVVVSVFTIPGYNNAVMVKHGEYYTTYSNLSTVYVKRGKKVKSNEKLGMVSKDNNTGNYILHFELWKGKNKQNPSHWIAK